MKKQFISRPFISASLLLSSLALLTGCNLGELKDKMGCQSCKTHSAGAVDSNQAENLSGQTLLSLNGQPVITTESYEEYWNDFKKSDPQIETFIQFMPNARQEVFKQQVSEKLIQEWIKDAKLDQDPEYQAKLKRQRNLADKVIAIQAFQDHIIKSIDTSDNALEQFYNENKATNPAFARPPFIKSQEGTKAQAVNFTDEKQAKDFLAKVQQPKADFAAIAKADKKDFKDLGIVTAQSKNADEAVKAKLADLQPGQADLVATGKNKFTVVKAISKQAAEFIPFDQAPKEAVKAVKLEAEFYNKLNSELEEMKKQKNAKENAEFFEKEREQRAAELQAQLRQMQAQEEAATGASQPAQAGEQAPANNIASGSQAA